MKIKTGVYYTQGKNCALCLHIGTVALYIGKGKRFNRRLELFTPKHIFRWS